jgi:hypothetical protein
MYRKILWYNNNFSHACHKVKELHSIDNWSFLKMRPHELQKSSFPNEVLILWLDSKIFHSLVSLVPPPPPFFFFFFPGCHFDAILVTQIIV